MGKKAPHALENKARKKAQGEKHKGRQSRQVDGARRITKQEGVHTKKTSLTSPAVVVAVHKPKGSGGQATAKRAAIAAAELRQARMAKAAGLPVPHPKRDNPDRAANPNTKKKALTHAGVIKGNKKKKKKLDAALEAPKPVPTAAAATAVDSGSSSSSGDGESAAAGTEAVAPPVVRPLQKGDPGYTYDDRILPVALAEWLLTKVKITEIHELWNQFVRQWWGIPQKMLPDGTHRPPNLYNQLKALKKKKGVAPLKETIQKMRKSLVDLQPTTTLLTYMKARYAARRHAKGQPPLGPSPDSHTKEHFVVMSAAAFAADEAAIAEQLEGKSTSGKRHGDDDDDDDEEDEDVDEEDKAAVVLAVRKAREAVISGSGVGAGGGGLIARAAATTAANSLVSDNRWALLAEDD